LACKKQPKKLDHKQQIYINNVIYLPNQEGTPVMKWSELRKKAEQHGWYLLRNGKEHDIYAHPGKGFTIQIARHDTQEVKTELYHKLKKQIGF
jgi:predicted RNA binding protein YcfA (HicA-like mRNA interferase family)